MRSDATDRSAVPTTLDLLDRDPSPTLVHWVSRADRLLSEATGLQVPALCGLWMVPTQLRWTNSSGGGRQASCAACQDRYSELVGGQL